MVAVQNLEGVIIPLVLSRKEGGHAPCKHNSSYTAYWIFMKLYTVGIHYLQMCMKEYGCSPKFGRGDNLTYTLKYVLYGEMGL
jgi:hypothetical protein